MQFCSLLLLAFVGSFARATPIFEAAPGNLHIPAKSSNQQRQYLPGQVSAVSRPGSTLAVELSFAVQHRQDTEEEEIIVRIPLNSRIKPSTVGLPTQPIRARIRGVYQSKSELAVPIGTHPGYASQIICLVYPRSADRKLKNHRSRRLAFDALDLPAYFMETDGEVSFTDPWRIWFLDNREVDSYECI